MFFLIYLQAMYILLMHILKVNTCHKSPNNIKLKPIIMLGKFGQFIQWSYEHPKKIKFLFND